MHWTKAQPSEPGWYWRRWQYGGAAIWIDQVVSVNPLTISCSVGEIEVVGEGDLSDWAGPITPPEEVDSVDAGG